MKITLPTLARYCSPAKRRQRYSDRTDRPWCGSFPWFSLINDLGLIEKSESAKSSENLSIGDKTGTAVTMPSCRFPWARPPGRARQAARDLYVIEMRVILPRRTAYTYVLNPPQAR